MQHNEKIHTFDKNIHRNKDCFAGLLRVPHVEHGNPSRKGQAMFGYLLVLEALQNCETQREGK